MKINLGWFTGIIKEFFISIGEIRELRKIEKQNRVRVFYADENNIIHEKQGNFKKGGLFLEIPLIAKLIEAKKIYYDEHLKPIAFVSKKGISTIDLNSNDSDNAENFSQMAYTVMSTKMLEALEEPSRRIILIVFLFGICIGIIIALMFVRVTV